MGLRDGRQEHSSRKFQMREKMFAVGDDYWVEDEQGQRAFKVNGKALRLRETFVLEDPSGTELATIREKKLAIRDTMTIQIGEQTAKVHKRMLVFETVSSWSWTTPRVTRPKVTSWITSTRSSETGRRWLKCRRSGSGCGTPTESRSSANKILRWSWRSRYASTACRMTGLDEAWSRDPNSIHS